MTFRSQVRLRFDGLLIFHERIRFYITFLGAGEARRGRFCGREPKNRRRILGPNLAALGIQPHLLYRKPTHFGPAPGSRQLPDDVVVDETQSTTSLRRGELPDRSMVLERHLAGRVSLAGEPVVTVEFHHMNQLRTDHRLGEIPGAPFCGRLGVPANRGSWRL